MRRRTAPGSLWLAPLAVARAQRAARPLRIGRLAHSPLVDERLKLDVDLISASGDAATFAARAATTRVPIVFAQSPDPVGNGRVRSLARPGANVTGLSFRAPDLAGKRIQWPRELRLVVNVKTDRALGITVPQAVRVRADEVIQ